ncbi:MAG: TlpA disulfide reductase family protein [Gammaproteobacteria bacterium]
MTRKTLLIALLSLLCFTAGVYLFFMITPQQTAPEAQLADLAPQQPMLPTSLDAIPLVDLEGNTHTLGEWTQTVLIINFWAPWCAPCRREVPALIALQNEYGAQLQILGLALDSIENIDSFVAEYEMNYPSFIVTNQMPMYSAVFGNHSGVLPFTAIIDQDRKIRYTHAGEISLDLLREELEKIL